MLYQVLSRIVDLIGSAVALIIFSPLYLLIAIAVKIDSPGPIFYVHDRVTTRGRLFPIIKFRSMKLEYSAGSKYGGDKAEEFMKQILSDPQKSAEFKKFYKLENDPRVTRVGDFLRKTSLDELPQFANVFVGHMSLVGPRAYLAKELLSQMDVYPQIKPHVKQLLTVKPGITGPWQVGGRSNIAFDARVQMDADYAQRQSVLYDIWIILKTPGAVLLRKGAR